MAVEQPPGTRTALEVMTPRPVTAGPDDHLARVRDLLARHSFRHLPVLENGFVVGVIDDRRLLAAVSPHLGTPSETPRDVATLRKPVHQVMARRPATARVTTRAVELARMLRESETGCVPVVDTGQLLVGIVTASDLLRVAYPMPERRQPAPG
ncbi:MAG: CBS domain-containing protein [Marmoricola sp.]